MQINANRLQHGNRPKFPHLQNLSCAAHYYLSALIHENAYNYGWIRPRCKATIICIWNEDHLCLFYKIIKMQNANNAPQTVEWQKPRTHSKGTNNQYMCVFILKCASKVRRRGSLSSMYITHSQSSMPCGISIIYVRHPGLIIHSSDIGSYVNCDPPLVFSKYPHGWCAMQTDRIVSHTHTPDANRIPNTTTQMCVR